MLYKPLMKIHHNVLHLKVQLKTEIVNFVEYNLAIQLRSIIFYINVLNITFIKLNSEFKIFNSI